MRIGFLTGAAGIAGLGFAGAVPVPTMIWFPGCMKPNQAAAFQSLPSLAVWRAR